MVRPHRVVVLAPDGVYPFDLGIPARVLGAANGLYEVVTCSADGEPVQTNSDFSISVQRGPEALRNADTVIVPGFDSLVIGADALAKAASALKSVSPGTRLVSICTGAFVLAAAGLLDGRPATTHWAAADVFRSWYPAVDLNPDVLFVDDGDIVTSAGAASGVDLCLHLIRTDHGSELANHAARMCVTPPWRDGGQAQYIERPVPVAVGRGTGDTREWARANLQDTLTLARLAAHAHMSPRTLSRRFEEEVGTSPGRWVAVQRIDRARELLEGTDLSVEEIAHKVGFVGGTSLREHFHAALGVSPAAYRRTFRGVPGGGS
ncbi:GlxA family transcriptional regulator [Microbacterium rhizomatis]|uniref:Helix-turn-helix domain-containing protein n=1 Tax=Microbacterium rhizomatis TaxID=1631477 RepID=A0A5J5IWL5_9MICO|nr:helix-turn-helix domain-containing protein [Microbacterium rhizomatis]KAA9105861.1 helix-turn-helix domain-containing protein [Microbacterium rhizomatis]